ncbi:MAG: hypothetical protein Kapaf2KO_17180 [Candidatus Kapaibacteriales bacterium]
MEKIEKDPDYIVNFSYRFEQGDVANFTVASSDSIHVFGSGIHYKLRVEEYEIVCDSVLPDSSFIISHTLKEFRQMENKGYVKDVKRTTHPWVDHTVKYRIDKSGKRLPYQENNMSKLLQNPGTAFQPIILSNLELGKPRFQGEKWAFKNEVEYIDNGIPMPRWEESLFMVMLGKRDTFEMPTDALEMNKTALVFLNVPMQDTVLQVVNSMNSFGILHYIENVGVPFFQEITSENKMKIYGIKEPHQETHHFINTKIILESYRKADGTELIIPKI